MECGGAESLHGNVPPIRAQAGSYYGVFSSGCLRFISAIRVPSARNCPNHHCRRLLRGLRLPGRIPSVLRGRTRPFEAGRDDRQHRNPGRGDPGTNCLLYRKGDGISGAEAEEETDTAVTAITVKSI